MDELEKISALLDSEMFLLHIRCILLGCHKRNEEGGKEERIKFYNFKSLFIKCFIKMLTSSKTLQTILVSLPYSIIIINNNAQHYYY